MRSVGPNLLMDLHMSNRNTQQSLLFSLCDNNYNFWPLSALTKSKITQNQ